MGTSYVPAFEAATVSPEPGCELDLPFLCRPYNQTRAQICSDMFLKCSLLPQQKTKKYDDDN